MKITRNGIVYELDMKANSAKVVACCTETVYEIVIPQTIYYLWKKFTVLEIANKAFKGANVRKITLPESITRIGEKAFLASKLSYIYHNSPYSLVIQQLAFADCQELKVAAFYCPIFLSGYNHFMNCCQLEKVTSEHICEMIPAGAFANCNKLDTFFIQKDVEVSTDAFFNTKFRKVFLDDRVVFRGKLEDTICTETILCRPNSKFLDLVYDGYNVSIIEQEMFI